MNSLWMIFRVYNNNYENIVGYSDYINLMDDQIERMTGYVVNTLVFLFLMCMNLLHV